jgi:hypothetical protein
MAAYPPIASAPGFWDRQFVEALIGRNVSLVFLGAILLVLRRSIVNAPAGIPAQIDS